MNHPQLIQLIIAYSLAGAFVFTVIVTCLSLVGWIKFSDTKQQQRLFTILIVELVVVCVGFFAGFLRFDPTKVVAEIVEETQSRREASLTQVKGLVAMLNVNHPSFSSAGAALIVGYTADRVYLVTANHLVRRRFQEPESIEAGLYFLMGAEFPARLLKHYNKELDLAVLVIEGTNFFLSELERLPFGSTMTPTSMPVGEKLTTLGNSDGRGWYTSATPDSRFQGLTLTGNHIEFESYSLRAGYSGGALFEKSLRLIGMITMDEPPIGKALRIDRIVSAMKSWGYPVKINL